MKRSARPATLLIALCLCPGWWPQALAAANGGAPPAALTPVAGSSAQGDASQAPPAWPTRLGMRVMTVQRSAPVQDRLVLVPDAATFVDEIGRWSPAGRWPVLIEDPILAPMFIRAFTPAHVIRRTDRVAAPADPAALARSIEAAVVRAFGGDPSKQTCAQSMQARGIEPLGLAAYSANDLSFVGAVALAAGRGLLPVALEGNFGATNDQLDPAAFAALDAAVQQAFASAQLPFAEMGDALDALVICRSVAHATSLDLATARIPSAQGMPAIKPGEPFAVTDALCRTPQGGRYAVCGTIEGGAARAAYASMCSLFLQRSVVWAIDSYDPGDPRAAAFQVEGLDSGLREAGFTCMVRSGAAAHLPQWREWLASGFDCDLLFLNSSGNADFFDLGAPGRTPPSSCGAPGDIPALSRPLALSMVHSFSLQQPATRETIGGRWLDGGAYAYAGSVHEPYLFAFVPPAQFLERLANGVPFGVASRVWEGPFALPWRISLHGDPLMPCIAPKGMPAPPRAAPTPMMPGEVDLVASCRALLARCKGDAKGDATLAAMRELAVAGQDRLAVQLWKLSAGQPWAVRVAPAALEPLFAQRDAEGFLKAYSLTPSPSDRQRDMLWQLCGPMLGTTRDADAVLLFEASVRPTWPSKDLERLMGPMSALLGPQHARGAVLKAQKATANPQQQAALAALLKGS